MQQPAASPTPSPSFAGMLAALAAPERKRPPARDLDGLEDDIATLSYERALRTHARYRTPEASEESSDRALTQPAAADAEFDSATDVLSTPDRSLKSASITIRMSTAECAQLRKRAAEAGLTMSAYLRSCTFEAESLRALVKDTLAQLRSEPPAAHQPASVTRRHSWRQWLANFSPHARIDKRTAQA